ncbi:hypothetical protein GCM10023257_11170 [Streptomyces hyderabadensis]|uniref:Uncharacterized protein n=1 Tax=Streptomyces hyderabadensis TaxID=598549 RepID=A0ABP9HQY7_9ACTN
MHRYCAGDAVPLEFAPVARFAALCGASVEQRLELHRRWLLAVAARHGSRTVGAMQEASDAAAARAVDDLADGPGPAEGPGQAREGVTGPCTAPRVDGGSAAAPGAALKVTGSPVAETDTVRRPWYRRGRVVASLVCGCAVLAALGRSAMLSSGASPDSSSGAASQRALTSSPSPIGPPCTSLPF